MRLKAFLIYRPTDAQSLNWSYGDTEPQKSAVPRALLLSLRHNIFKTLDLTIKQKN